MINLLSPQQKKEILREEKLKLFFISAILALFFLATLCLPLWSIKFYIASKAENQKIAIDGANADLEKEIALVNQRFSELDDFYSEQTDFSAFFGKLSALLPEGLYLTNFSATLLSQALPAGRQEKNKLAIILAGFAPTRQLLFEFKQKLDADPELSDVDFPPSDWIKNEKIEFTVTFKTKL